MNILVIGAGGFIGSHLCEKILESRPNDYILAIDINPSKISHLIGQKNFEFRKIDVIKEREAVEKCVSECDVVFPLAAIASPLVYVQDPLKVFELDFESNLYVIRAAVKYKKRVIFPSTSEVYGMCNDDGFDEKTSSCVTGPVCKQRWIYSCSKQMLDRVIYAYGERDNLSYTLFRPFNWIGPRLDDIKNSENGASRVVTQFLSNILHGKDIKLVGGGEQIRCFTYISDGIDALIKILENKDNCAEHQIFNIGNPKNECSIKQLAEKILSLSNNYDKLPKSSKIITISPEKYYGESYQDVSRRIPSIANANSVLNWSPRVDMDELLTKTMDYYFK